MERKVWRVILKGDRISIVIGFLIGAVVTRFFEDGNLLVTTVFTIFCIFVTRGAWAVIKRILNT
jgi:hypothetical protein